MGGGIQDRVLGTGRQITLFHVCVHLQLVKNYKKIVSSFCTCKIKNFCFAFMRIHYSFLNCKKIFFFLRQSNKKSRGYKPRLIIRNVLYTLFMNSLLNIKNRVVSYSLFVTHGRFLFFFVRIYIA